MMESQIVFIGNTAFEAMQSQPGLREFKNAGNVIDLSALPLIDGKYEFVYSRRNKNVVENAEQAHLADYIPVRLWAETVSGKQLEPWQTHHLNNQYSKYCVYYADSFMRKYLCGRAIEFDFSGDRFTLDVASWNLFETANPANQIEIAALSYMGEHGYQIIYDPIRKNLSRNGDAEGMMVAHLDQMVIIDPVGMAKKYQIDLCQLPKIDLDPADPRIKHLQTGPE